MILLNSTIKGKQEVKTASKWKGGETPPNFFFSFQLFIQVGETLPSALFSVSSRGGGSRGDDTPPSHLQPPLLSASNWPAVSAPIRGSIDSLVHNVKAGGAERDTRWHSSDPLTLPTPSCLWTDASPLMFTRLSHMKVFSPLVLGQERTGVRLWHKRHWCWYRPNGSVSKRQKPSHEAGWHMFYHLGGNSGL